jgi:hypothetical protein
LKVSFNYANFVKCDTGRLWWAPELLRDEEMGQLGTRQGDIYAFGVIIHEILGKQGPFGIWSFQTTLRDPKGNSYPLNCDVIRAIHNFLFDP